MIDLATLAILATFSGNPQAGPPEGPQPVPNAVCAVVLPRKLSPAPKGTKPGEAQYAEMMTLNYPTKGDVVQGSCVILDKMPETSHLAPSIQKRPGS